MHQLQECQELSRVYDPDAGGVTLPLNWGDLIPSDVNRVVASDTFYDDAFLCGSFHSWQHSFSFPPNLWKYDEHCSLNRHSCSYWNLNQGG